MALILCAACDTVEADLPGRLVQMSMVSLADGCTPGRMTGDAGTQFVVTRPDGGLTFTWPITMQWGPLADGGVSGLGERVEQVPARAPNVPLGNAAGCLGGLVTASTDAGIEIRQTWPSQAECPTLDFTAAECSSTRVLVLNPLRECSSRCVRYDAVSGEASCDC